METIAALFSADALLPGGADGDGAQSALDDLVEKSHKHAAGVSKELRSGIRESIEVLANEVIVQRLAGNKAVYEAPNRVDAKVLTTQFPQGQPPQLVAHSPEGYHQEHAEQQMFVDDANVADRSEELYLQFPGLDAQLFDTKSTELLDGVTLRNEALQQVCAS